MNEILNNPISTNFSIILIVEGDEFNTDKTLIYHGNSNKHFTLNINKNTNQPQFKVKNNQTTKTISGQRLKLGEPNILIATYDGEALSLQVNDYSIKTKVLSNFTYNQNLPLHIGSKPNISTAGFTGKIHELLIYNQALSSDECETIKKEMRSKWNISFSSFFYFLFD